MQRFVGLMVGMIVVCMSSVALAKHTTVKMEELEGTYSHGQLHLNYEISPRSWRRLERRDIRPILNLYRVGKKRTRFLYSQVLRSRKGSFTYPKSMKLRKHSEIEIEIIGFEDDHYIRSWRFAGEKGRRIAFEFHHRKMVLAGTAHAPSGGQASSGGTSQQPPPPPANWRAKVVEACDKHAYVSSQKGECVRHAMEIDPRWAAETVAACDRYGYVDSQINECIDIASKHKRFNPAETAKACNANIYVSSHFLDCMRATASYDAPPKKMLPACSEAVYVDSQKSDCIELAADLKAGDASLLRACKGRDWEECLRNATR